MKTFLFIFCVLVAGCAPTKYSPHIHSVCFKNFDFCISLYSKDNTPVYKDGRFENATKEDWGKYCVQDLERCEDNFR